MVQHKANQRGNRSEMHSIVYYGIKVGYKTPMSLRQSPNNALLPHHTSQIIISILKHRRTLSYSFYHLEKNRWASQGLPAEKTAQLFDHSKHCETFSFQGGIFVFPLIPQMIIKRENHLKLLPVSLHCKRCTESKAGLVGKPPTKQAISIIKASFKWLNAYELLGYLLNRSSIMVHLWMHLRRIYRSFTHPLPPALFSQDCFHFA